MKSVWLRCSVVLAVVTAFAGQVEAQRRNSTRPAASSQTPRLGGHLGYNFDVDAVLLGPHATFPLSRTFDLYPSFDFYFTNDYSMWALNLDVRYRPTIRGGGVALYFGGGLNYARISADGISGSNTSLNILGGLEGRSGRAVPFGEMRITVGDASSFQLAGGMSWRL